MKFNQFVPQADFKTAYDVLKSGVQIGKAKIQSDPNNITAPYFISQEQPFVNTKNQYIFEFGTSAPAATSVLNNTILGQNNAMVVSAFQILIGYGATANNRAYYSRGFTAADNSLYSFSTIGSLQLESNTPVQNFPMNSFYEEGDFINGSGMVPIKPMRVLTGLISKFQFIITFNNSISALTLSSNMYILVVPMGAGGLA